MSGRPSSGAANRPASRSGMRPPVGPVSSGVSRPPGTASRLATGMTTGSVTGGGVALSAQLMVSDRPMTQQGLGGMRNTARGPQRQVQDRTYYLGLLRGKISELTVEIQRLHRSVSLASDDQSSYVSYEKRAEVLARDIRELQGELGDYNTLVDKLNTDESINDIRADQEELRVQNSREAVVLDSLFEQRQMSETQIRQLEVELQQEKSMTENLVAHMNSTMKQKYVHLKDLNDHLLRQLEAGQQQLDQLNSKKAQLEEDLAVSPVKQEAVRLYEQLSELEEKREQLEEESRSRGTPQEERERLLRQVKDDNQEIGSMERQNKTLAEKVSSLQDEIRQLDMDIEENQGERNQKYKDLRRREETMDEFMDTFEDNKIQELEKIEQLESNVVLILEHLSRSMARFHHMPTPNELGSMKDDLAFKQTEMKRSEATASGLAGESDKLHQDLQKVELLETKISQELETLRSRIASMTEELDVYSDLDKLRLDGETKKKRLGEDKVSLAQRRDSLKESVQRLNAQYDSLKAQLNENETYAQLGNLEKKWQHHEQNNFVMKEFIATKTMECDYGSTAQHVAEMISHYNEILQDQVGKTSFV